MIYQSLILKKCPKFAYFTRLVHFFYSNIGVCTAHASHNRCNSSSARISHVAPPLRNNENNGANDDINVSIIKSSVPSIAPDVSSPANVSFGAGPSYKNRYDYSRCLCITVPLIDLKDVHRALREHDQSVEIRLPNRQYQSRMDDAVMDYDGALFRLSTTVISVRPKSYDS